MATLWKRMFEAAQAIEGQRGSIKENWSALRAWRRGGFNVFVLTPELCAALLLTDVSKEQAADARVPYSAFALDLPLGFFNSGDSPIRGLIAYTGEAISGQPFINDALSMRLIDREGVERDCWMGTLAECHSGVSDIYHEGDDEAIVVASRMLVNFLLWLNNSKPAIERRASGSQKSGRRDADRPGPKAWVFGTPTKLQPHLVEAGRAIARGERAGASFSLRYRFLVRGHWRNQPHGPGRVDRRKTWIEPHWKGPDGAEAWAHIYKAGD